MHPLHPVLVHAPVTCWTLVPFCDGLALALGAPFFWSAAAFLAAIGVGVGALAATAGALDFEAAHARAPRLATAHAALMGTALTLSAAGLLGRVDATWQALTPAPYWAIAAGAAAFAVMLAGAWCGGEMVYGRGVGVRDRTGD